jgi:hypothetical protein
MIINLWSTPRTGSNWYASYLYNDSKKINSKTLLFSQYLNYFHFINYIKPTYTDWIYTYEKNCFYPNYSFNWVSRSIKLTYNYGKRTKTPEEEEEYRIELLEKHDHEKVPLILSNHILPMSDRAYNYLFQKANKNIFIYRENIKDQLSSYALAYTTQIWKPKKDLKTLENISTDKGVLKNLYDRIVYWHNLNKINCEVIKYEEINFTDNSQIKIEKQNKIDPFIQLDTETQNYILELCEDFKNRLN